MLVATDISGNVAGTLVYIVSASVVGIGGYMFKHRNDAKDRQIGIADSAKTQQKSSDTELSLVVTALIGAKPTPFNPHPEPGLVDKFDSHRILVAELVTKVDSIQAETSKRSSTTEDLVNRFGVLSSSVDLVNTEYAKRMKIGDELILEFSDWKSSQIKLSSEVATITENMTKLADSNTKMSENLELRATVLDGLTEKVDNMAKQVKEIRLDSKSLVIDSKKNHGTTSRDSLARIEESGLRIEDGMRIAQAKVDDVSGAPDTVTLPEIVETLDRIEENTKTSDNED